MLKATAVGKAGGQSGVVAELQNTCSDQSMGCTILSTGEIPSNKATGPVYEDLQEGAGVKDTGPGQHRQHAVWLHARQRNHQYHIHSPSTQKKKDLFYAFVDLEKAFDHVPREVVWCSLRKAEVLCEP